MQKLERALSIARTQLQHNIIEGNAPPVAEVIMEPLAAAIIVEPPVAAVIVEPPAATIIVEPLAVAVIEEPSMAYVVEEIPEEPLQETSDSCSQCRNTGILQVILEWAPPCLVLRTIMAGKLRCHRKKASPAMWKRRPQLTWHLRNQAQSESGKNTQASQWMQSQTSTVDRPRRLAQSLCHLLSPACKPPGMTCHLYYIQTCSIWFSI
jgi:hypothetical protein